MSAYWLTALNWIQAIAAACVVGLTWKTLVVLRGYATDTSKLARDSASQVERSQMPFLTIVNTNDKGYSIQNQGYGPALNIMYSGFSDKGVPFSHPMTSLAAGAVSSVHAEFDITFRQHMEFAIDYASLSGFRYRTTINCGHNDQLLTKFSRFVKTA
jgi:hypothetical protein